MKEWLEEFQRGKKLVAKFDQSSADAVHDICRYIDESGALWETAVTYTGRLVVRDGHLAKNGVTIEWNGWKTMHDVHVPKEKT